MALLRSDAPQSAQGSLLPLAPFAEHSPLAGVLVPQDPTLNSDHVTTYVHHLREFGAQTTVIAGPPRLGRLLPAFFFSGPVGTEVARSTAMFFEV